MSRDAAAEGVKDHLVAGGILAERESKPAGAGWQGPAGQSAFVPYAIVWAMGGPDQIRRLGLSGGFDDLRPVIHVRTVGATGSEADALLDDVRARMTTTAIAVTGHSVTHLIPRDTVPTDRDPDTVPDLWFTGQSFELWLAPQ